METLFHGMDVVVPNVKQYLCRFESSPLIYIGISFQLQLLPILCLYLFAHIYYIQAPSHFNLRLKDNMGKVHGSLARAGKVRGQTPKVEKQEKKKSPRGRAKKRMQYNRRYVNVVTGMGGKKVGPNSNADKMK
jgi:small subunit ribosomal protein S30e